MGIETDYRALSAAGKEGLPLCVAGGVVVIGNFDGVHRGHQALLAEAKKIATAKGLPLTVLTFEPHPRLYFNPQQPPFLLTDKVQKQALLKQAGADEVVSLTFDALLAQLTAAEFAEYVLRDGLRATHVVVGENFLFGVQRQGNVETLKTLGKTNGFEVTALGMVGDSDQRISSERIRGELRHGHVASAQELLCRPWQIRGEVIKGNQLGRTLGYPTANLELGGYLHPAFGVYSAKVTIDQKLYTAAVSIGVRPTIGISGPLLEAYVLDFAGDLYGKILVVDLLDFLRPELKFGDLKALTDQIAKDVAQIRAMTL